jgi:hypothetical protein
LKKIAFWIAVILVIIGVSGCIPKTSAAPLQLSDVKAGANASEYLVSLAESMSAVRSASSAGTLEGILYNPSDKEMKGLLTKLFREKGAEDKAVKQLVSSHLDLLERVEKDKDAAFSLSPVAVNLVGKNISIYVVGFPGLISVAQTDGDVQGMILHELQHVEDTYYGAQVGTVRVDWRNFASKEIGVGFWETLGELRATHRELIRIFGYWLGQRNRELSELYVVNVALRYSDLHTGIERQAGTPFEKGIAKTQTRIYRDVIPFYLPDGVRLDFNIEGQKSSFFIKRK